MHKTLGRILSKLRHPSAGLLSTVYLLSAASIIGSTLILTSELLLTPMAPVGYLVLSVAAITLFYPFSTAIPLVPRIRRAVVAFAGRHALAERLLSDFGFRTLALAAVSFLLSLGYGIFNGVLGILLGSPWYGALAAYYILLALVRGLILIFAPENPKEHRQATARIYRDSGILLIALQIAMTVAITQMILDDRAFAFRGTAIYAHAAYTFYKITMSVVNLIRARRGTDLTVEAIRNVSLADALISILALQTALLATFSQEGASPRLFNTMTGTAVSLLTLTLGIFMTVKGIKIIRLEKSTHGQ